MMPRLITARLTLGAPTEGHVAAFRSFVTSAASRFLGGPVEDPRDVWYGLTLHTGQWLLRGTGTFWAQDAAGSAVGRYGIFHPDWRAEPELSWLTFPPHEGRGYAREAAEAIRSWFAATHSRAPLMSLIDSANTASIRVAEALGAKPEAEHSREGDRAVIRWRHPEVSS